MAMDNLNLVTVKKASAQTGASLSFFRQLIRQNKLKKYRINSAIYISLREFEQIASGQQQIVHTR